MPTAPAPEDPPAPPAAHGWLRRHPLATVALALLLCLCAAAGLAGHWLAGLVATTPDGRDIGREREMRPGVVLTLDGQELAVLRRVHREWVPLDAIAPTVVQALLATEDRRFWEHAGLDWRRTLAAAWQTSKGDRQGGSTITQQLARNLYPVRIGRMPTLERKAREAITALRIEDQHDKREILEAYLNTVPFLYNTRGIEMAARTYFGKGAGALDAAEAATLVGMLKGTRLYNPVLAPERARQRRNLVLAQMQRAGWLDAQQLQALQRAPLQLAFERPQDEPGPAPHLAQQARQWLLDWAERHGRDPYADGLVLRTTIDSRAQALATQAVQRQLDALQKLADAAWSRDWDRRGALVDQLLRETPAYAALEREGLDDAAALHRLRADRDLLQALRRDKTRLEAGLLVLEPGTGQVRAWVGSRDFAQDQYDHVAQARRQPGSTFKPFVYGAAFAQGARLQDQLVDRRVEIAARPGEVWRPSDSGAAPSEQPMALRDALAWSRNTITAQLVQGVGPAAVGRLARAMGVRESRLDEVPSLGLGTSPVTLREMVGAYATLANGGLHVAPRFVLQVEDRYGRVLERVAPPPAEAALDGRSTALLLQALRTAVDHGTGAALRTRFQLPGDLAGKTGTTQDNTDGWFILVHPQLVAGAWVGHNDARITMRDPWGQGARSALPVVGDFFREAFRRGLADAQVRFDLPDAVPEPVSPWWAATFPPPPPPPQPVQELPPQLQVQLPEASPWGGGVQRVGAQPPWQPQGEASGAGPAWSGGLP